MLDAIRFLTRCFDINFNSKITKTSIVLITIKKTEIKVNFGEKYDYFSFAFTLIALVYYSDRFVNV